MALGKGQTTMKIFKWAAPFLIIISISVYLIYSAYRDVRKQMIGELHTQEMILAKQAAKGIENLVDNYWFNLDLLSKNIHIVDIDTVGESIFEDFITNNSDVVRSIMRVNSHGDIIYAFPNSVLAGFNISDQDHIKLISSVHKTVFSDVITGEQGCQVVSLDIPIFKNTKYDGSICILINYDYVAEKYLGSIKIGRNGYAWAISEKGIELYSPIRSDIGKSVYDIYNNTFPLLDIVKKMQTGEDGVGDYLHNNLNVTKPKKEMYHAAFYPVHLYNTFWSICVTAPESQALLHIDGFRNRCIAMLFFVALMGFGFFLYFFRFTIQKRTKDGIAEQLNFLQTLLNTIPSPIFYKDIHGIYLGCNSAFEAYVGRSKTEVVGKTASDFLPKGLADVYRNADLALFDNPGIQQYEASIRYADGDLHDIIFTKATFSNALGQVAGMVGVMLDITERRRAEKGLEQALVHLENVFQNSPDGIGIVDKEGKFIKWNKMAAEQFGYTFEELKGRSAFDLYADKDELDRMLTELRREGAVKKYAVNMKKKGGATNIFEISISLLRDDTKSVSGSVCVARDLSEIRNAMMALEASNKRLEQEIREHREAEKEIRRLNRLYDLLSQVNQTIVRIQSKDDLFYTVCRLVVERGNIDLAWIGWLDPETSRIDPVAHFENHTLKPVEELFHADVQKQSCPERAIRECKPFVCGGCDSSQRQCFFPAGRAPAGSEFRSCGSFPFQFQGEVCGALTLCVAEQGFFQEREIELLDEVTMDISFALDKIEGDSQRSRLEEQNLQQSMFLGTLIDAMPYPVVYKDTQMRYLGCNRAFERFTGIKTGQLIGLTVHDIWSEDSAEVLRHTDRELLGRSDRQPLIFEETLQDAEGINHDFLIHKAIFQGQDGKTAGVIGVMVDITERKRAEEERARIENQLQQAQKMEALGTLAGGIAHDFNNILGIIIGFTELSMYELGKGTPVLDKLDEVLKATNRAKDLVKQILAFSRRSEQQKMPLQLGIIVKDAMKILRPSLPSTIEIRTNVSSKAAVLADPTQMHQVLMNLCTNAAHAMQDHGGILEVNLTDVVLETQPARFRESLQPGRYVELTVKDSGLGIDPGIIDLIFDPFFTTKQAGEGTGLGLSVVHGVVKSHGGGISVESTVGKGTTFTVLIPVLETDYVPEKAGTDISFPTGRERVLVVDDEPMLAEMIKRMLEKQGYDAVSRTSGGDALEAFRNQPAEKPFDLVITDMTMPHITGVDLTRELSKLRPQIPVILMTGFSNKIDADKIKEMGIQGFLMKPVGMEELTATVRAVLDRKTN
jgi:PAS domain S-box-containing protein